jgi:nicotinamide-nucleotide amidase
LSALEALAQQVVDTLRKSSKTLVTAESCSVGMLAAVLADTPGAGDVFDGGFVTYSKRQKENALGVGRKLMERETAVSPKVATAMALGALKNSPADIAVGITGVVGPEPDEDGNPVGRVCIAIADRDGDVRAEEFFIDEQGRDPVRNAAIAQALTEVLETLGA